MLKQSLPSEKETGTLNNVAYSLADMNVGLDLAQECGERSLHRAEAESMLANSPESGFAATQQLGYIWDTVGWIYFRRGDYEKALPYVRASWLLSQDSPVGDHLGQIYAKLGKTQEAAHTYRLAYSRAGDRRFDTAAKSDNNLIIQHYKELMGKDANPGFVSTSRRSDGTFTPMPAEELSRMRWFKIRAASNQPGNAVFSIVFSSDKVEEVKYVSGSESLKAMDKEIAAMKFRVEFPDVGPARVYRRGMAVCEKVEGCNIVLLLPDSVHAVDQAAKPN